MRPYHFNFIIQRFQEATKRPYEYLLIDKKPNTLEPDRLRTDIFSNINRDALLPANHSTPVS